MQTWVVSIATWWFGQVTHHSARWTVPDVTRRGRTLVVAVASASTLVACANPQTPTAASGGATTHRQLTSKQIYATPAETTTPSTAPPPMASDKARPDAPYPVTPAALGAAADQWATSAGDSSPTDIQYVVTTLSNAESLAYGDSTTRGPGVDPSAPVALIAARGTFTGSSMRVPPGAAAPTGSVLTLIVDASGICTDQGLSGAYPDLSALGTVSSIS